MIYLLKTKRHTKKILTVKKITSSVGRRGDLKYNVVLHVANLQRMYKATKMLVNQYQIPNNA